MKTEIRLLKGEQELAFCAELMFKSDPWVTLNFNLERCSKAFMGDYKETYVALKDGKIVGFATVQLYGTLRGYIQSIAVVPELRGKGLGRTLLTFCETRLLRDFPNVFICVSSFNLRAQKLYENLGFEKVGEFKDMFVRGYDEILLRKSIGSYEEFLGRK
jgi:ribosomal-protein-alanine N-acetyltransferase